MGKTYRRNSDFEFKGKKSKNGKKIKKLNKEDFSKKKTIEPFLEEDNNDY